MTGTDDNAIVNESNKPTATIKPKAQPSNYHAIGSHRLKMKIATGNGDDAHLYPSRRWVDVSDRMAYDKSIRPRTRAERAEAQRVKNETNKN